MIWSLHNPTNERKCVTQKNGAHWVCVRKIARCCCHFDFTRLTNLNRPQLYHTYLLLDKISEHNIVHTLWICFVPCKSALAVHSYSYNYKHVATGITHLFHFLFVHFSSCTLHFSHKLQKVNNITRVQKYSTLKRSFQFWAFWLFGRCYLRGALYYLVMSTQQ